MIELMNGSLSGAPNPGDIVDGIFVFNPGTTGIVLTPTFTQSAGITKEEPPTLGDPTFHLPAGGNANIIVDFGQAIDLRGMDWTLEWSSRNEAQGTTYYGEIGLFLAAETPGVIARYGDSGFGNRLQFGGNIASAGLAYNARFTKTALNGVAKRYALVSKAGQIAFFAEGVREMYANGVGTTYNVATFATNGNMSAIRRIKIGSTSTGAPTMPASRGKVRFSLFARYTDNYEVEPF